MQPLPPTPMRVRFPSWPGAPLAPIPVPDRVRHERAADYELTRDWARAIDADDARERRARPVMPQQLALEL
jgi:hypothetical protein